MTFWTKAAGKAEIISPEAKRRKDGDGKMEEVREGAGGGGFTYCSAPYHLHGLCSPRPPPCK